MTQVPGTARTAAPAKISTEPPAADAAPPKLGGAKLKQLVSGGVAHLGALGDLASRKLHRTPQREAGHQLRKVLENPKASPSEGNRLIREEGADTREVSSRHGRSGLHALFDAKHDDMDAYVEMLRVLQPSRRDFVTPDVAGNLPIMRAAASQSRFAAAHAAMYSDPRATNHWGDSALSVAKKKLQEAKLPEDQVVAKEIFNVMEGVAEVGNSRDVLAAQVLQVSERLQQTLDAMEQVRTAQARLAFVPSGVGALPSKDQLAEIQQLLEKITACREEIEAQQQKEDQMPKLGPRPGSAPVASADNGA